MNVCLRVLGVWFIVIMSSCIASKSGPDYQSPVDVGNPRHSRTYRSLELDNNLQVLLIHDPEVKKSAAAMDVNVGSLADPQDTAGLAHYLEHMLFLGTAKYPDPDEYSQYLSSNQGYSNAYTAGEDTNYFFESNHDAFEGALDRFSQFFVAPLFAEALMQREVNAVHSEHQKNLQNDSWRTNRVLDLMHSKGHPSRNFSTGNNKTLASVTRKKIMEFYDEHYSANLMKLVLLSNVPLDKMEEWVKRDFSAVPNKNRKRKTYSAQIFDESELPRLVEIEPITERRELVLRFPMPSTYGFWRTRPDSVISHLVGHEGEGSLLSQLKKEDLAISLSSGTRSSSFASTFVVSIGLTKKGLKEYDRVTRYFFEYMAMLRSKPLPGYVFTEQKALGDIAFVFRQPEEGGGAASHYSALMQHYPPLEIDQRVRLYDSYSDEDFQQFLGYMKPNRLLAFLTYRGAKTDKTEKYYGVKYGVRQFPKEHLASWAAAKSSATLHLPRENEYLPEDLSLFQNGATPKPVLLMDDDHGQFWFQQDDVFELPRARLSLRILSDEGLKTPRDRLLLRFYVLALRESINQWTYVAHSAGLDVNVDDLEGSIRFRVSGYSEHLPKFFSDLLGKLKDLDVSEKTFLSLREAVVREEASRQFEASYRKSFYEVRHLMNPMGIHRDSYKKLVSSITLKEVEAFANKLYARTALMGAAYGNLENDGIKKILTGFHKRLGSKPIPRKKWPLPGTVKLRNGQKVAAVMRSPTNNSALVSVSLAGEKNPSTDAIMRVAEAHSSNAFYSELRTRQQLGYIVASYPFETWQAAGMLYLVQSSTHKLDDVAGRIKKWKRQMSRDLKGLDQKRFDDYKSAIIVKLKQSAVDMDQRLNEIFTEGILLGGRFGYRKEVVTALEGLTLAQFKRRFGEFLDGRWGSTFAVYVAKKGERKPRPKEKVVGDVERFRKSAARFK